ncbi:MAG: OmpA family protein [Candidatus Sabulitectum sp.]|nr:OmpA family protein [Candidatus Sabulitectum sp.]
MRRTIPILLAVLVSASVAAPSMMGVPGLYRVNSAIPLGFNEISFKLGTSYWTAANEYTNFIYHSHYLPQTLLFPEITETEHTGQGRLSLAYGVWDYVDLAATASYSGTYYERDLYEERSTGHWEEIQGFESVNIVLHGGYNPIPTVEDIVWLGADFRIGLAPADTVFLRNLDDPDGQWHTGQMISTVRKPFSTTGNGSYSMDFLITGDFGRWLPMAPAKMHLNFGYSKYTQNYNFTDFRVSPDSVGWNYSDSTSIALEVTDGIFNFGFGLEVPTPYADIFFEYTNQKLLDRDNASVSYFTPGVRFKNNSGTFIDITFDLSTSEFDPQYYDLGHRLYQTDSIVTEAQRAERAPLPIGGVFDWGVGLGLGFSSDMMGREEQSNMATLSGTVTDSLTGAAIFSTITFPGVPIPNVTSDEITGFYTHLIPAGEVPVTVVAPGYRDASAIVVLGRNQSITLDFLLVPNLGTISGSVRDGEGRPVANATVIIGSTAPVTVTTSTVGVYTAQVEAGTWPVAVQAEGYISDNKTTTIIANETVSVSFTLRSALRAGEVMSFDNIYFASGSANLKPESFPILDSVAILLRDNPTARMQIAGHTDSDGGESANQTLSQNRAQSVYQYLISKGIAGNRLTTIGHGETNPTVPNNSAANKARNRRIEFTVLSI